jgi:glycosyltransferase involved in cell wall biosynthesis
MLSAPDYKIAYVLRTSRDTMRDAAIDAGRIPRWDFDDMVRSGLAEIQPLFQPGETASKHWLLKRAQLFTKAYKLLRGPARSYDVLIATGEDIGLPIALTMAATGDSRPLHIFLHGHFMNAGYFRKAMTILGRRKNVIWHPLSKDLGQLFCERFGLNLDNVMCTGYSVDTEFFAPNSQEPTCIVSAGAAHRDYDTLVEAARHLEVPMRIAAASTWIGPASPLQVKEVPAHITFKPTEGYTGLRELYGSAYFVVVPMENVDHACGYAVIAEAMAMGKAVIATRTHALSDFVINGETGFLVAPGNADELYTQMKRLIADPQLAHRMGQAARRLIEEEYSLEHFRNRLLKNIVTTAKQIRH